MLQEKKKALVGSDFGIVSCMRGVQKFEIEAVVCVVSTFLSGAHWAVR